jgi:hypothetical protein
MKIDVAIPNERDILSAFRTVLLARYGDWLTATYSEGGLRLKHRDLALECRGVVGRAVHSNSILAFTDINRTLDLNSQVIADAFAGCQSYSYSKLIDAKSHAQEHLDSSVYLPSDMRKRRLSEVAEFYGISEKMLIRLGSRLGD